jgi:hypothetical protein
VDQQVLVGLIEYADPPAGGCRPGPERTDGDPICDAMA